MNATDDGRRWPWLASAGLLAVAAGLLGRSVWLHWTPCHGPEMTAGLPFGSTGDFSGSGCLLRMDAGTPFIFPTELPERTAGAFGWGAAAMIVAALVWVVLAAGLRLSRPQRVLLLVPAALQLGTAAVAIAEAQDRTWGPEQYSDWGWLEWLTEPTAAGAVIGLVLMGGGERLVLRLVVIAWGATAGGAFHQIVDFMIMSSINEWNWDTPPGTGFGCAAVLGIAAALTSWLVVRSRRTTSVVRRPDRMAATA